MNKDNRQQIMKILIRNFNGLVNQELLQQTADDLLQGESSPPASSGNDIEQWAKIAIDDLRFLLKEVKQCSPGSYRAETTISRLEQLVPE